MEPSLLYQVYGWIAYLSAAATLLTLVTGILFFTVGKPFGKINDISSVLQVLLMIPLAVMFVQGLPFGALSLLAAVVGILGMLVSAVGQSLLVFGRIDFEGSTKFFPAGAAIGMWLILICVLGMGNDPLPGLLPWIGILAGAGYIATVIGFLWGGQENVLFYIGGFVLGIAYPIWATWLGRLLLSGTALGRG
jgi:hypothetical protein